MHKMCSDESICAVMKGCLCSDKKGYSEILLFWKNRSFISESPAFGIEMCSDEFSLKHALTSLSATVPSKKQISGIGACSLIGVTSINNCLSVCFALSCFFLNFPMIPSPKSSNGTTDGVATSADMH